MYKYHMCLYQFYYIPSSSMSTHYYYSPQPYSVYSPPFFCFFESSYFSYFIAYSTY